MQYLQRAVKWSAIKEVCHITQGAQPGSLWRSGWVGWERGERFEMKGICIQLWLILTVVRQKPTQSCKPLSSNRKKRGMPVHVNYIHVCRHIYVYTRVHIHTYIHTIFFTLCTQFHALPFFFNSKSEHTPCLFFT